ncbi:MAG: hypothetical protein ACYC3F_17100 [Gemmatimonadaceae bacterium]
MMRQPVFRRPMAASEQAAPPEAPMMGGEEALEGEAPEMPDMPDVAGQVECPHCGESFGVSLVPDESGQDEPTGEEA